MSVSETIESVWSAIEQTWLNDRTFIVWIIVAVLVFAGSIVVYLVSTFTGSVEKMNDRSSQAMEKVAESVNKNTEAITELRIQRQLTYIA